MQGTPPTTPPSQPLSHHIISQLHRLWGMAIKETSRSCMVAAGGATEQDTTKWPLVNTFLVLGHLIHRDGSIRPCWARARSAMWRAFWGNAASDVARNLSRSVKLQLISRAVAPQIDFRCSRWPPQKNIAHELDNLQQKMVSIALREPKLPEEDVINYVRRRGRIARKFCSEQGFWSQRRFKRVIRLISRATNNQSWPARLYKYHDKGWLIERRASFIVATSSASSILAGRTGTRAFQGCVHTRWHDGVEFASSCLAKL